MADFARVVLAVDQIMGTDAYTMYADQASKTAEQVAEGDSVTIAVRDTIVAPWEGTASDLLKLLTAEKPPRDWPATPQGMAGRLVRAAPSLRSLGWTVEKLSRSDKKGSRRWGITPPAEEYRAGSSASSAPSDMAHDQDEPADVKARDLLTTDEAGGSADHSLDSTELHVSAGQDVTDDPDMPAGTSSVPPTYDPTLRLVALICDECNYPVESGEHERICESYTACRACGQPLSWQRSAYGKSLCLDCEREAS
jgi:hypothetical protein